MQNSKFSNYKISESNFDDVEIHNNDPEFTAKKDEDILWLDIKAPDLSVLPDETPIPPETS